MKIVKKGTFNETGFPDDWNLDLSGLRNIPDGVIMFTDAPTMK